ncbi:MAG: hypothetical protein JWO68_1794 [Actinomycetia bacterium]|nr:hypothetical protein [Actinomycetes bacterium]
MSAAIAGERSSDVPCGECTACCTASQFIHIGPDEVDALAHIPTPLLFPAPGLPAGHVLMGYDERGHCPMLVEGRCTIYAHRPRTCRTYDCRVFPATGIEPDDERIAQQARRWVFDFPTPVDQEAHDAVRAAAAALADTPATATQRAVLALELHDLYLGTDPDPEAVRVEVRRRMERP